MANVLDSEVPWLTPTVDSAGMMAVDGAGVGWMRIRWVDFSRCFALKKNDNVGMLRI